MRSEAGRGEFVMTMVQAIVESKCEYFRVHDSGDMFNSAYVGAWLVIALALPNIKFWIPTRAWQAPSGPLAVFDPILNTLRKLAALPNVAVRPSALNFGDYAPQVSGLHAGSTAANPDVMRSFQCPAYLQGGTCGDCRTCWEVRDMPVSYCKH